MKKILLSFTLMLGVLTGLGAQSLPDVKLEQLSGAAVQSTSLIDHRTPFVISFWASWCKPCQKELDALGEIAPDWDASFPLRIYAVCVDDARSVSRAKALLGSRDWPVTPLFDTNSDLRRALNVSSIPHVFVFDKDGKQVYTHVGYVPGDEENLLDRVKGSAK